MPNRDPHSTATGDNTQVSTLGRPGYFSAIDTPEKAYWLGFVHADGCVSPNGYSKQFQLILAEEDALHAYKFADAIGHVNTISHVDNCGNPAVKMHVYSQEFIRGLESQGVGVDKTDDGHVPGLPEERRAAYLRGYFDGDGSFYRQGKRQSWTIHCKSGERLETFYDWLGVDGGGVYDGNQSKRLVLSAKGDINHVWQTLWPDGAETEPCLERKAVAIKEGRL